MTLRYSKIDGIVKAYIEGPADEVADFVRALQDRFSIEQRSGKEETT